MSIADEQVAGDAAVHRHCVALLIQSRAEQQGADLDEAVAFDHRVIDLLVAVQRRVVGTGHHTQRRGEVVAGNAFEVIVAHGLVAIDHTHPAGMRLAMAEEHIALDPIAMAVAQHQ
ncbi:hypothetical protein D3C71_1193810 [compost metagenome]